MPAVFPPVRPALALALIAPSLVAAEAVDYSRDVLPILSANCFVCHGRDISTRKAKLRLDLRSEATRDHAGIVPVTPGKPDDSEMVYRITSTDEDERMPPADKGRALTSAEVETLRDWIAQGANYNEHWAFLTPKQAPLPSVHDAAWSQSPIDRFVRANLEKENLVPAGQAARATLIRRASLDLTGLPPTPAEIDAFVADQAPNAYEKLVDRLLASPHYGERYGRHWLDVARYADSGGFETDLFFGHAWRFRDYVIRSFNADKPFDRFIKEQIAGDELYPNDKEARIATGFYTTGPVLQEAGMVKGKLEYDQLTDAVDTTGAAFLGMTFACARCHDHKYDPVSQREYYSLQAIFAASDQFDYSEDGKRLRDRAALKSTIKEFEAEQARERAMREKDIVRRTELLKKAGDAYVEADPALKIRVDNTRHFDAITRAVEQYYEHTKSADAADPLAEEEGDDNNMIALKAELRGFVQAKTASPQEAAYLKIGAVALLNPINNFGGMRRGGGQGAFGERRRRNAANAEEPSKAGDAPVAAPKAAGDRSASEPPPPVPDSVTPRPPADAKTGAVSIQPPSDKVFPRGARGTFNRLTSVEEKRQFLLDYGRQQIERTKPEGYIADLDKVRLQLGEQHLTDISALPVRVLDHREVPLETHLLKRGELEMPGELVDPGLPEKIAVGLTLKDVPSERRRSALANWIASKENLLTARVIVNRVWQWHFGEGLVRTPNDFGIRGERPTHPELLDWLAVDFMDHGWSIKRLNRLIMLSQTYQMEAEAAPATIQLDPENRLLARFQPHRLEAEEIWDNIRAVAGTLDETMFGLPIAPPLDEQEQLGNYRKWPASLPDEANRRAVYILVRRSFRFPVLSAFDLPDNISSCGRRDSTVVPNQALTLMNNRTMREQAGAFADRLLREDKGDIGAVPSSAWRYVYGRAIQDDEKRKVAGFLAANGNDRHAVAELCLALFNTNEFIYLQ